MLFSPLTATLSVMQPVELILPGPLKSGIVVLRTLVSDSSDIPSRQSERLESRAALSTAIAKLGFSINLNEAKFEGHQKILELDDLRFSISHTERAFGCWALRDSCDSFAMGFDIERTNRVLTPAATSRIVSPDDDKRLSALQIWCAKEAAFKSLSAKAQDSVTLPAIRIVSATVFNVPTLAISGSLELNMGVPDLTLAFAWSQKRK